MTIFIKLIIAGADTGPFDLYTNLDGYTSPFETDIPRQSLVDGYLCITVPEGTTSIKVKSNNQDCNNYIILDITGISSTTTTTTTVDPLITTTTTTTNSSTSTTTTTTTIAVYYSVFDCYGQADVIVDKEGTNYGFGDFVRYNTIPDDGHTYCGQIDDPDATGPATGVLTGNIPDSCNDICYGQP